MFDRRELLKAGALFTGAAATAQLSGRAFGAATPAAFRWDLTPPESAGMSRSGIDGIRAAIQKNIDSKAISGAVTAVARRNKLVLFEAQGWADVDARRPMKTDSLFRIMSSSKAITAVAVMMMVEEGKLALEDPVSKFIPTFRDQKVAVSPAGNKDPKKVRLVPATRYITIKDLLTHTAGLSTLSEQAPGLEAIKKNAERRPDDTLSTAIPRLGTLPLDFQPGTKWRYSPLDGMDTLLYLVELVSRTPADRFLQERVFSPLDMKSTYFNVPASEVGRLVKIYAAKDGTFEPRPWLFREGPFKYFSGAGGLTSCAHDMLNFEVMLLNSGSFNGRRLLKPATVALMSQNHVGSLFADWIPFVTRGNGFGLGVSIVEDESRGAGRAVGAFGWGGAYGTETWADPKLDIAAVMLIQMDPAPPSPKSDFTKAIRKAIVG